MSRKRGKKSRGTALNKHPILFLILGPFKALTLVLTQLDKSAPRQAQSFHQLSWMFELMFLF